MKYCHDCKYFDHPIDSDPCKNCLSLLFSHWRENLNENSELFLDKPYFEPKEDEE